MELHSDFLMPEYWLLSSDDQAECTQVINWLKTHPELMLKWRLKYDFVRTLPLDRLLPEAKQLIDNGSPCVHVWLHGGEPDLGLKLRSLPPRLPLHRQRMSVNKLSDATRQDLFNELIGPDSWSFLAWHFGRRQTVPDLPFPPGLMPAASEYHKAFAQWVASLTTDDLEDCDDMYGTN